MDVEPVWSRKVTVQRHPAAAKNPAVYLDLMTDGCTIVFDRGRSDAVAPRTFDVLGWFVGRTDGVTRAALVEAVGKPAKAVTEAIYRSRDDLARVGLVITPANQTTGAYVLTTADGAPVFVDNAFDDDVSEEAATWLAEQQRLAAKRASDAHLADLAREYPNGIPMAPAKAARGAPNGTSNGEIPATPAAL